MLSLSAAIDDQLLQLLFYEAVKVRDEGSSVHDVLSVKVSASDRHD